MLLYDTAQTNPVAICTTTNPGLVTDNVTEAVVAPGRAILLTDSNFLFMIFCFSVLFLNNFCFFSWYSFP